MTETYTAPPAALCEACGKWPEPNPPSCAGCERVKPACGCTRGWSQSQGAMTMQVQHLCPACTLKYP